MTTEAELIEKLRADVNAAERIVKDLENLNDAVDIHHVDYGLRNEVFTAGKAVIIERRKAQLAGILQSRTSETQEQGEQP